MMSIEIFLALFLILIVVGAPIWLVMAMPCLLYFMFSGIDAFMLTIPSRIFDGLDNFILTAIPFFLIAGDLMNRSGMSDRLVEFANLIVGRVRGGLAQVNVASSLLFAGITGVAVGDVASLGKIFIPNMEKEGYSRAFAAAVTAASSLVGPIIPPSVLIIFYASIMDVSVAAMFAAALVPGALMAGVCMVIVAIQAHRRQYPKRETRIAPKEATVITRDALLALFMPVFIIGTLLGGVMTPTEAAAAAAVYALVVGGFVFRALSPGDVVKSLTSAAQDSSKLMLIIAMATMVGFIFAIEDVPNLVKGWLSFLEGRPLLTIFIINLIILMLGFWTEPSVIIILFVPIFAPMMQAVDIHPVTFGIMVMVNCMIGLCTPPVGNVLFAIASIVDVNILEMSRELLPFLVVIFGIILTLGIFPGLTLAIPSWLGLVR